MQCSYFSGISSTWVIIYEILYKYLSSQISAYGPDNSFFHWIYPLNTNIYPSNPSILSRQQV